MPTFEPFDVVAVPFPYTDRAVMARRPALVISRSDFTARHGLLWVLMITSAENAGWPDDVPIQDHAGAGLTIPSIVRPAKIATVDAARARSIGKIPRATAAAVTAALRATLA